MIKRRRTRRRWRFSEKVVFSILLFCNSVFISAIVFAFMQGDGSIWAYLIPAIGALSSSAFAVFVWKEKNENLPKILHNPNYDAEKLEEELREQIKREMLDSFSQLDKDKTTSHWG